jgi:hypothetical protein
MRSAGCEAVDRSGHPSKALSTGTGVGGWAEGAAGVQLGRTVNGGEEGGGGGGGGDVWREGGVAGRTDAWLNHRDGGARGDRQPMSPDQPWPGSSEDIHQFSQSVGSMQRRRRGGYHSQSAHSLDQRPYQY